MSLRRVLIALAIPCHLAACQPAQRTEGDQSSPDVREKDAPVLPIAEPALDRRALLLALAEAASAAALGDDDLEVQRALDGKRFELRLRFGCDGAAASQSTEPRRWTFDERSRVQRFHVAPEVDLATPLVKSVAPSGFEAAEGWNLAGPLRECLWHSRIVARGAKARSTLRRLGFEVAWQAPSETMEEVVDFLTDQGVESSRVALQLFDPGGHPSTAALAARCRELVEIPVYRWLLPDDAGPAARLIEGMCAGAVDAVTFTSQPAVHHLFHIAESLGRGDELRAACNGPVLPVCVGPVCAEAARQEGISEPVWPDPARLVAMIQLVARALSSGTPPVR